MGHLSGISWVYQHPELHRDDMIAEYRKVEPYLSLDYNEAVAREEKEETGKEMLKIIMELQKRIASLESRGQAPSDARAESESR
jgi:hypothetical protein